MTYKIKKLFDKKKLHYLESLIYILCIVIVVLANVFGPIWVRMLPLLFILGIIGKIAFDRPVITTVFGSIISICAIYLSGVTNILENIIASSIFTLYIALGELCGSKIEVIYNNYIKKSEIKGKKCVVNMCTVIAIVIVTTLFHNYTDSNLFMYNSCKGRLIEYLNQNYLNSEFDITNARFTFESERGFKFNVKEVKTDNNYKFIVYEDNELNIFDGIIQSKKSKEENVILRKIATLLNDKYKNIKIEVKKIIEGYQINLTKELKNVKDSDILEYSKEVCDIFEVVIQNENLSGIQNLNISLIDNENKTNSRISTIYVDAYKKNKEEGIQEGYTYIMKSLNIEYID